MPTASSDVSSRASTTFPSQIHRRRPGGWGVTRCARDLPRVAIRGRDSGYFKRITEPRAEVFEDRFAFYAPDEIRYDPVENAYQVVESSGAAYSFENPDFDFRQFRGNVVVRWEYQPGSTLFVVWSQDRTREGELGNFSFRDGLRDLFQEHAFNVFLVKFTYRFST